jgi:hypothetical protein
LEARVGIELTAVLQTKEVPLESIASGSQFLNFRTSLAQN